MRDRIRRINPPQLHPTSGYHHITVVEAGRLAVLAGQCPVDADDQVVGVGDLDAQIDQVVANSLIALGAVEATPAQVIRSAVYIVSADSAVLADAWDRFAESAVGAALTTSSTLVGVAALGYRNQLVELDLTAALDQRLDQS
ncbi:MAG TPA: Rid family hydrolase [Pseudonocardiaceae bacterium]|nr:Rid family hydrolase [Pseudonocardiaceae bacterium]